jgi:hypothetical protein
MVKEEDMLVVLVVDKVDESVEVLINDGAWKVGEGSLRTSRPVWWVSEGDLREVMAGIVAVCVGVCWCSVREEECVKEREDKKHKKREAKQTSKVCDNQHKSPIQDILDASPATVIANGQTTNRSQLLSANKTTASAAANERVCF